MTLEDDAADEGVILVEPGGETSGADPYEPTSHGTAFGLLILFLVILAGIMASNVWLRKRAERAER